MAFWSARDRAFAQVISRLNYCNPFLPERIQCEREALGAEWAEAGADWNIYGDVREDHPNLMKLMRRAEAVVAASLGQLRQGVRPRQADLELYEDLVLFVLYHRCRAEFAQAIEAAATGSGRPRIGFYDRFARDAAQLLMIPDVRPPCAEELPHLFACFFQLVRAFRQIFHHLIGISRPAARFRAAVWQSIFTHDLRRYRRALYRRMADLTTLILGPSGTGKELAARAIGRARYIPFDPATRTFTEDFAGSFHALNLSALSPTLIESELFGHRRGAFTGALDDRTGWLEVCPPLGTVFLDEIGELDATIQVKLLRVLQTRAFQRIGDTRPRHFHGKIIAATNRDLAAEMRAGRFRADFYYRLCSDILIAPALHEQLRDRPEELHNLTLFIARRLVDDEAEALAAEAERFIEKHLGPDYPWPGNVRELEQCVRNVLVRGEYRPRSAPAEPRPLHEKFAEALRAGRWTADEVLRHYCSLVYAQCGSYEKAARRLRLDRRTVKSKVDPQLVAAFQSA